MNNSEWASLFNKFDSKKVEFESNKHLFTKIAFGTFQLNSAPHESLWTLEDGEDGKQYLCATYEEAEQKEVVGNWSALSNKEASMVVLLYKNYPIHKFAASDFGFNKSDAFVFSQMVSKKANSDKDFVSKILDAQPEEKKSIILAQFPELTK